MRDETRWVYHEQRHEYSCSIGPCTITAWDHMHDRWSICINAPGRRSTVRHGFRSLEEAEAWSEAEVASLNAMTQEPPLTEREAGA